MNELTAPPLENEWPRHLVAAVAAQATRSISLDWHETEPGRQILAATPEEQRLIAIALAEWMEAHSQQRTTPGWCMQSMQRDLFGRRLPFEAEDIPRLAAIVERAGPYYFSLMSPMIKAVKRLIRQHGLSPVLLCGIEQLVAILDSVYSTAQTRRWARKLRRLGGLQDWNLPLVAGDVWADAAMAEIEVLGEGQQAAWSELLLHCQQTNGAAPSGRWLKAAAVPLAAIGSAGFKQAIGRWFPLVDEPRTRPLRHPYVPEVTLHWMLDPVNADMLKGLAWLCAQEEDAKVAVLLADLARSAFRRPGNFSARCARLGNACLWVLGQMPIPEAANQLMLLKDQLKLNSTRKQIQKALAVAAQRAGLTPSELEEQNAPTLGFQSVGRRTDTLGEFTHELTIDSAGKIEQRWLKPDGKRQASVPAAVKEHQAEAVKQIAQAGRDVRKMLLVQRDRVEGLYLERRRWRFDVWRERYLDHPLVGVIARRLIWKFSKGDQAASGIWHDGQLVDRHDQALAWLDDATQVELWHPLEVAADVVLAWRNWMLAHEVVQPFKQAYREVYLLTDAERQTQTYSNRFAAHILRQHQFNALCLARGWKNALHIMADVVVPPAMRRVAAWGLRAEFWAESIGDDYGVDTTEMGAYLYVATDQVRFYPIEAVEHRTHSFGGGYFPAQRLPAGEAHEAMALENVAPLVFSEIMRDVDLFVGVASVGNDPSWLDGGREGRHQDYWNRYSFGDISETAATRRQVLDVLFPRLKIAPRCRLEDRFLVVRGDRRTYKIHLGSGNILMEPNDQYLCIVPGRGARGPEPSSAKVFLPFEGDAVLRTILSKAFLLANDTAIQDPSILRQIR